MNIQDVQVGQTLKGIEPSELASVMIVRFLGESLEIVYETTQGIKKRLFTQSELDDVEIATEECPWSFDGNPEIFQLCAESKRIDMAFLFDPMMAVHTSNVEPLPHQITAVYESMLPRQPLRYVLADDPGAGKTIMAGLYIRELMMRADAQRVLIVAPGSLVGQWRDELFEKFGLDFRVFSRQLVNESLSGNAFEDNDRLIARLDQLSRAEDLQVQLENSQWDLIVFDEAHKLSANYFGNKVKKTGRFRLAESLGARTRHLLLMTATPHNGKEEDFQLFLSLLDSDRFYGRFREDDVGQSIHKVDVSDMMRRMVKEELVRFDGRPLFPERRAYTVNYDLSKKEAELYNIVTEYVKTEMGKADQLDGKRKGSVGFALTSLQRRLASSPEAIYKSLDRRKSRLEKKLREKRLEMRTDHTNFLSSVLQQATVPYHFDSISVPEDEDDLTAEEMEDLEAVLVDQATASQTIAELGKEIEILDFLKIKALELVKSGEDRKWDELSKILQNNPELLRQDGSERKIIIFTEHKDTLTYLQDKITGLTGRPNSIVTISGKTPRQERKKVQELFRSDPDVKILLATDAAGEGVNLQVANLMVNYDLPWNPNRLEQRFGRIHRIGQQEVCHLWNLVAKETREGDVYYRLLSKLEVESKALKGRVFDILGDVFENISLRNLLLDAIKYGEQPEVKARLYQQLDTVLATKNITDILERNALVQETMNPERLFAVREEMEKAEARKLQPSFVRAYFLKAFQHLGGVVYKRELGRYEITHVSELLRSRDRQITGRNRRQNEPVLRRYERVCFSKEGIQPVERPGSLPAVLLHPGHPLMLAITDLMIEENRNLLKQGTTLIDPTDAGKEPKLLVMLTHEIKDGFDDVISKRFQFVYVHPDGSSEFAGWSPHLDLQPLPENLFYVRDHFKEQNWLKGELEQRAIEMAAGKLVPEHFEEVRNRRVNQVEKTLHAVHDRLRKEINFQTDRWMKLKSDKDAGKDVVEGTIALAERTVFDLQGRLKNRKEELNKMKHVANGIPEVIGAALVIPQGFIDGLSGESSDESSDKKYAQVYADLERRKHIERLAMNAVIAKEQSQGRLTKDVSAEKCGWDVTSYISTEHNPISHERHLEVKGKVKGSDTLAISSSEIRYALNQGEKFRLAVVLIDEHDNTEGPYYIKEPFQSEPDWGETSRNINIQSLIERSTQSSE